MKPRKSNAQKQTELEQKRKGEISTPTSIRLSPNERAIIEKKAAAKGMRTTAYIVHAAVHGSEGIEPKQMIAIQNIVNHAVDVVKEVNPDAAKKMESEANELWRQLL